MRTAIIGVVVSMALAGCRSDGSAAAGDCVASAIVAPACGHDGAAGSQDEESVASHLQSWHNQGIHSYSFDLAQQLLGRIDSVHIVVESDAVVSVIDERTGLAPDHGGTWPTIDELFDFAEQAIEGGQETSFDVEYDAQYGYITVLDAHGTDPGGGYAAQVYNFVPAP